MKTKHLLTAIALPAIFAACNNEELPVENVVKENLENRPLVENVTLSFGDAQSRAALQNYNKITFAEGDKLGVALVDNWNNVADEDPIGNYSLLTNSINTNYIFTSDANGNFTSEAAMVEGNYVFYYPYNTQRSRQQILTDLPKEQTLTKMADGSYTSYPSVLAYSEEKGAPIAIAYDFLSTEDAGNALEGTLKQIYATPLITLTNVATETVDGEDVPVSLTIKEIVLGKSSGGSFTLSAPLKFADAANTAYTESDGTTSSIVSALFNETIPSDNNAKKGPWVENILNRTTSSILGDAVDGGTSSSITLKLEKPVTIPAEGTFSFYAVIPAGDYTTDQLTVTVYNEDGYAETETLAAVKLTAGQRYPEGEFDANGVVNSDAKGLTMTAGVGDDFDTTGKLVSTVDEMITAIKKAEEGETLSLRIGGNAVINSRVASLLALSTSTKANEIEIVNEVAFDGASITWNPALDVEFKAVVTVNEGAVVELKDENTTFAGIINKGTLSVYDVSSLENISNKGVLNLMGNLNNNNLVIDNDNALNIKAWGSNNANKNVIVSEIHNGNSKKVAATMAVDAAAELTATVTNLKGATIDNEGTVSIVNSNEGTINNGSEENVDATIANVTENNATINNYGKLTQAANNGTINMLDVNAIATVTGTGTVANDVLAKVTTTENTVTYTVTGAVKSSDIVAADLISNSINTLILSDATITVSDNWAMADGEKALAWIVSGKTVINSGKGAGANLKITGKDSSTALNITISKNSKLTVNSGVNFETETTPDVSAENAVYDNKN